MSIRRLGFYFLLAVLFAAMVVTPTKSQYWSQNNNNDEVLISGRNVNMVEGTVLPEGDPWLQRQNEPSIAVSTRNPLHLLAAANDYRTVDMPGIPEDKLPGPPGASTAGDAWIGIFKSFDGGESWITELLDGYPQLTNSNSPLHGYQAAADPVVRAGPDGLFYICGIVFQRDPVTKEIGASAVFVARYRDNNNKEKGDTIEYLGTEIIDSGDVEHFIDKCWLAVDVPHGGGSHGNVYLTFSVFTRSSDDLTNILNGEIKFVKSEDGGENWIGLTTLASYSLQSNFNITKRKKKNEAIFQGSTIAVDPRGNGHVYVAWRKFGLGEYSDTIIVARSANSGKKFHKIVEVAEIDPFDQPTTPTMFRTNCYPSMTVDDNGVVYIAWSQRGPDNKARIVIATSPNGINWSAPTPVELTHPANPGEYLKGHQFMPTITYANGKLMAAWYDSRYDKAGNEDCWFADYISDDPGCEWRHTIDVRIAQAEPGRNPVFNPSIQVSRYIWVIMQEQGNGDWNLVQGQWNPPNFPLFQGGTTPFIGDYIDISPSPMFVWDDVKSRWQFNTEPTDAPVFHVTWTDNRDVRPPWDEPYDWTAYTPPNYSHLDFSSEESPECGGFWKPGMRNQNVYTSKISWGLEVGSTGNSKPLNIPRAFIIEVNNTTDEVRSFRLMIGDPGLGGQASFLQFGEEGYSILELDVTIAPHSSISRPVFFQSSDPNASLRVDVVEIDAPGGDPVQGGLTSFIILNPGDTEATIEDPDGWEGASVGDEEIYDPVIELSHVWDWSAEVPELNPNIWSPNIWSPNIWSNPVVVTPNIWSPNIWSPNIWSPNIWSPNIWSPNIWSPNIWSPNIWSGAVPDETDLENAKVVDVVWKVKNEGNTTSSYTFKTFTKEMLPEGIYVQLIVYKTTYIPITNGQDCELQNAPQHEILANIANPNIWSPNIWSPNIWSTNMFNDSIENATFSVPPGEEVSVLLRLIEENPEVAKFMQNGEPFDLFEFAEETGGGVTQQQVNTKDAEAGIRLPRAAATNLLLGTAALPDGSVGIGYIGYVDAVGGDGNYTYSLNSGELPDGLDLYTVQTPPYPYNRGLISGTPTTEGTYYFVVQVDDGSGLTDTQRYKITIHTGPVPDEPTITTLSPLPNAVQGNYYVVGLEASGGQLPYIWTLEPGSSLPDDLSLDEGGAITGKPVAPVGTYTFTVRVTDQDGDFDTKQFSLEIRESTGTDVTISGMVYDANNNPLDGVVIRGLPNTPITGSGEWDPGYYEDSVPKGWEGTAIPFKVGHSFTPESRSYDSDDTQNDIPNQNYNEPIAAMVTISGTVNIGPGSGIGIQQNGLDGVTMNGLPGNPVTSEGGYYEAQVALGWSATVTPEKDEYIFEPVERRYEAVSANLTDQDYEGVEGWIVREDVTGGDEEAVDIAVDSAGNVIVAGNSGNAIYLTKYNKSDGTVLWSDTYNDGNVDKVAVIAVDSSDLIYVTGQSGDDILTFAYDRSKPEIERILWDDTKGGAGNDMAHDIAVFEDGSNVYVYVTGESNGDYYTIGYDAREAVLVMENTYGGEFEDKALAIAVDPQRNVYVTGQSMGAGTGFDIATIKYDKDGNEVWFAEYDGAGHEDDIPVGIAFDSQGSVFVGGSAHIPPGPTFAYVCIRYDKTTGSGGGAGATYNYQDGDDLATDMAIFEQEGVTYIYVTGTSDTGEGNNDLFIIRFHRDWDPQGGSGVGLFAMYDGGFWDGANAIALDPYGQVYVTGRSVGTDGSFDYVTIKYTHDTNELWVRRYHGGSGDDIPHALILDAFGNVCLTGESLGDGTGNDFTTIQYKQSFDSLIITTTSLPDGIAGVDYAAVVWAFGGSGSRTWSYADPGTYGDPHPDLSLNPSTGVISGTPSVIGTYNFRVLVEDGALSDFIDLSIAILSGLPDHLEFALDPAGCTAGDVFAQQPGVLVKDMYGNTVTLDNSTEVTLDIDNNPSGGSLLGDATVTVESGEAVYSGLSINNPGSGYTLVATASGFSPVPSGAFDVNSKITGLVMFNELAVTNETSAEASFRVQHVSSGQELSGYTTEYNTTTGSYTVYNVPPGSQYYISIRIDTSTPPDSNLYPGEFYGYSSAIDVPSGQAVVNQNLEVEQIMHLIGPIDNNIAQQWPGPVYDEYSSPVLFDWDALGEATTYQVKVYKSNGSIVTVVDTPGITETQASIPLPVSLVNEHYEFELWAFNGNNVRVGRFMIVYTSGYGWDYNFRVIPAVVSQVELTGPSNVGGGFISEAYTLTSQDIAGNPVNVTQDTVFGLSTDSSGIATFYSDSSGTTPITQVTIPTGQNSVIFYYKDDVAGTPTVTAAWDSGGSDLGSDTHQATVWAVVGQIVFTSSRDGNYEVYAMNSDGSGQTNLTNNPARDTEASWSPDGSKVVFRSDRDGNYEIYVMNADGSWQTNLTNNSATDFLPCWSPDGSKIAFTSQRDGNYEVYAMNSDGTGQTNLTISPSYEGEPSWSPDGSKIAFTSQWDGNYEVYVMNSDGSGQTNLTNHLASDWAPSWSPDGSKIAFSSSRDGNSEVYVMNADGTGQTNLTYHSAYDGYPSWSPDGSRITFLSDRDGDFEIYVMSADGSEETNLTINSVYDHQPNWGGSKIAFVSNRDGDHELYIMNVDGTGQTKLTDNAATDAFPSWSPDGTKIAYTEQGDNISVINSDGTGYTPLTTAGTDFKTSWSPDGSKIAFSRLDVTNYEIFVMDADGSNPVNLTNYLETDVWPSWSPYGSKIVFQRNISGNIEIFVMNSDGTLQMNLTNHSASDTSPSCSPDGEKIAFTSTRDDGNGEIYTMNSDGTNVTRLTDNVAVDRRPAWSPDGRKIVFESTRAPDGNYEVYVMNADGSGQTNLTNYDSPSLDYYPHWRPQARIIPESYEFVTKWGSYGTGDGEFYNPYDIVIDSSGYVYVVDSDNHRIQKFTLDGVFIGWWGLDDQGFTGWHNPGSGRIGSSGNGDGQFSYVNGIAVDSSGYVYVTGNRNHRIQKFTSDGVFIGWWGLDDLGFTGWHNPGSGRIGSSGNGDGQFYYPGGVAVDSSGYVYVADWNHRIQKFDSDGVFIGWWGLDDLGFTGWHNPGSGRTPSVGYGPGQFYHPQRIAIDSSGYVYVTESGNHRIQKFTSDGTFVTKWAGYGTGDGRFNYPNGVAVDSSDYVYVADRYNDRIQKFTSSGTFVTKWGSYGTADGLFYHPLGVAVDSSGYVYVADPGNSRIQKFKKR